MKAYVHTEFVTLRPGDHKNSRVFDEVVEGSLAVVAVQNGFAEEVDEDTPVGKLETLRVQDVKPAKQAGKQAWKQAKAQGKGKGKQAQPPENGGGSGEDGDQGEGL